jgi:cyclopropane-fatty-acyl-phospholipid synthase
MRRSLKDDGVALLHSIGRLDGRSPTNPWFEKYIFPGGYLPSLAEVLPAIEKSALIVTDIEILRLHYADTLRAWRNRFLSRRAEAAAVLGQRFCRMWEFYLAGAEVGLRYGGLMVFQIQLAKKHDAVPRTRILLRKRRGCASWNSQPPAALSQLSEQAYMAAILRQKPRKVSSAFTRQKID